MFMLIITTMNKKQMGFGVNQILLILSIVSLLIFVGWIIVNRSNESDPKDTGVINKTENQKSDEGKTAVEKIKIKDYKRSDGVQCAALTPECGYCPGKVVANTCFVTQAQFDEYKAQYSDLKADN